MEETETAPAHAWADPSSPGTARRLKRPSSSSSSHDGLPEGANAAPPNKRLRLSPVQAFSKLTLSDLPVPTPTPRGADLDVGPDREALASPACFAQPAHEASAPLQDVPMASRYVAYDLDAHRTVIESLPSGSSTPDSETHEPFSVEEIALDDPNVKISLPAEVASRLRERPFVAEVPRAAFRSLGGGDVSLERSLILYRPPQPLLPRSTAQADAEDGWSEYLRQRADEEAKASEAEQAKSPLDAGVQERECIAMEIDP